eukprot:3754943-Pleurochrysis_carterae.AAC.1
MLLDTGCGLPFDLEVVRVEACVGACGCAFGEGEGRRTDRQAYRHAGRKRENQRDRHRLRGRETVREIERRVWGSSKRYSGSTVPVLSAALWLVLISAQDRL